MHICRRLTLVRTSPVFQELPSIAHNVLVDFDQSRECNIIGAHQLVGSSTASMTASLAIRSISSFSFSTSGRGTLLAVASQNGVVSSLRWITCSPSSFPSPVNNTGSLLFRAVFFVPVWLSDVYSFYAVRTWNIRNQSQIPYGWHA